MEAPRPIREETSGFLAVVYGVVAAVVGAVVWGLITRWTEYEVGIVAVGIGVLVGAAVARAGRGPSLQVLAAVLAVAGVLLGKYLGFVWGANAEFEEQGRPERLDLLASETFNAFKDPDVGVFGWFDLLWIGFAVYAAWRIAKRAEPPSEPEASPPPPPQ